MKKISFRLILAAFAATAALTACTKEITPGKADTESKAPVAEGSRTIAVSFAPQTKTYLDKDSLQPKFKDKDSILLVSYPADPNEKPITDTCKVRVDGETGAATISTDLTGDLMALYPVKYAKQMPSVM